MNYLKIIYRYFLLNTPKVIFQRLNPLSIPILIINFNQLHYLEQQVNFYLKRGFKNIVIIDNASTFQPLLDYYNLIGDKITVEFMKENEGHLVFFKNDILQKKYGKGYYIVTDADILPNINLPENFMAVLIKKLDSYFDTVSKVGFALEIADLPNYFPHKNRVLEWESQYWKNEVEEHCYLTKIDTTFALYKPQYPYRFSGINFYTGLRIAGDFTAKHGGWYKNPKNLTEEEIFYENHASVSASWAIKPR